MIKNMRRPVIKIAQKYSMGCKQSTFCNYVPARGPLLLEHPKLI